MTQHWTEDCFNPAHIVQTDMRNIEKNFECVKSCFSGPEAPPDPVEGMLWFQLQTGTQQKKILHIRENNKWRPIYDAYHKHTVQKGLQIADSVRKASIIQQEEIKPKTCSLRHSSKQIRQIIYEPFRSGNYVEYAIPFILMIRRYGGQEWAKKFEIKNFTRSGQVKIKIFTKLMNKKNPSPICPRIKKKSLTEEQWISRDNWWIRTKYAQTLIVNDVQLAEGDLIQVWLKAKGSGPGFVAIAIACDNPMSMGISLDNFYPAESDEYGNIN